MFELNNQLTDEELENVIGGDSALNYCFVSGLAVAAGINLGLCASLNKVKKAKGEQLRLSNAIGQISEGINALYEQNIELCKCTQALYRNLDKICKLVDTLSTNMERSNKQTQASLSKVIRGLYFTESE